MNKVSSQWLVGNSSSSMKALVMCTCLDESMSMPSELGMLCAAVMLTPLARSPSCIGELVNCASQPTPSLLIWQRVWPDLVSMNT